MKYKEQIERIKSKLILAKNADTDLKIFGAKSHRYFIDKVVTEEKIINLEREHQISLPSCYRSFLTQVGNGGCSYSSSAVGPFYGIYPLGGGIFDLTEQKYLKEKVNIAPNMTEEYWLKLTQRIREDDEISDNDFDREMGKIYSGILPIGSQGCTHVHAIVLNGENKGRVVNIDIEIGNTMPKFAYEDNFLDWYERWLDEIISGDLIKDSPTWFGYCLGGTEQKIIKKYLDSINEKDKIECLIGLFSKNKLNNETIQIIERECSNSSKDLSCLALQLLTINNYQLARNKLKEKYKQEPLIVFQYLNWYAKDYSEDWITEIKFLLSNRNIDSELFDFITYVAKTCKTDLSGLIEPFTKHENEKINRQAVYILAELKRQTKDN
jgi:hypothetical protein